MKILAVRHTSVNVPSGFCYGQSDVPLAPTFEKEKVEVLQRLSMETYQRVYSSPLTRCTELAESVWRGYPVVYDHRLLEMNFGEWECRPWDEIAKTEEAKAWFSDWVNVACPGGESYLQLLARVQSFIQQIVSSHFGENILVVTHGGVIRSMISLLSGMDPKKTFDLNIDFGSITKLDANV